MLKAAGELYLCFTFCALAGAVWVPTAWTVYNTLRFKLEKIGIFYGGTLWTIKAKGVPIEIGWIPTGTYVQYDEKDFNAKPYWKRAILIIASALVMLISGMVCIGPEAMLIEMAKAPNQLLQGVLHPKTYAPHAINAFFDLARGSWVQGYGTLIAKGIVFQILPMQGGAAVGRLLSEAFAERQNALIPKVAQWIGLVIAIPIFFCWGWATLKHFWNLAIN